jgi:hypothetical protein
LAVEQHGGTVVGPIDSVAEALLLLASRPPSGAVLDCQLADRDVTPLALRLLELGIPFVINTGTGPPPELAAAAPDLVVLVKPVRPELVVATLAGQMGLGAAAARLET